MKVEYVRVCGVCYRVTFADGPYGEPEIVRVHLMGDDGRIASCQTFAKLWYNLLSNDHVEAIQIAVNDGNFLQKPKPKLKP